MKKWLFDEKRFPTPYLDHFVNWINLFSEEIQLKRTNQSQTHEPRELIIAIVLLQQKLYCFYFEYKVAHNDTV